MPFYDNLDVIDYLHTKFTAEANGLGLGYVAYAEEEMLPKYPALVFSSGGLQRGIHTTNFFLTEITVDLFILHAALAASHRARTREDLLLCRAIVNILHLDTNLDGNIVHGYAIAETPGEIINDRDEAVVSTKITWRGNTREPFRR